MTEEFGERGVGKQEFWLDAGWVRQDRGLRDQVVEVLPLLRREGVGIHGTASHNLASISEKGLDPKSTNRMAPAIFYYAYRPEVLRYDDSELVNRLLGSVRAAVIWAINHSDFEQAYWLWRDGEGSRRDLEEEMPVVIGFPPPQEGSPGEDYPEKVVFPIEWITESTIQPSFQAEATIGELEALMAEGGERFDGLSENLSRIVAGKMVAILAARQR